MSKPKIVSLSPLPSGVIQSYVAPYLKGREVEVVGVEKTDEISLAEAISDADIVIGDFSFSLPITRRMVEKAKGLKLIQQPSTGYEHIDIEACADLGIPVANIGGANAIAVAEHTVMLALALLKKVFYCHHKTAKAEWAQQEMFTEGVFELQGKNYGIIGLGRIGREVAKRIAAFSANVLYYDKYRLKEEEEEEIKVSFRPLDKLLRESDIVSLHLPLTEETRLMIGERELTLMGPSAYLINVARGELVDEAALSRALKQKSLAGAGLDVFSDEPIKSSNPLLTAPNVILTPHVAGATNESRERIIKTAIENVVRVLEGKEPVNVVNGVVK